VRRGPDEGALLGDDADEMVPLELREGFPDGGAADLEAPGQLLLGQGLAGVELAIDEGLTEGRVDGIGEVEAGPPGHAGSRR
jgi:hypothetical protein